MRFVAISDVHSAHRALPQLPAGDVLLYAGDITSHGTLDELLDFRDWLVKLRYRRKIIIAGNHDRYLGDNPTAGFSIFGGTTTYLENSGHQIDHVKIWGSPVNQIKGKWAFNSQIEAQINMISATDILLVHGPPVGILDTLANPDHHGDELSFGGTPGLLEKIEATKPKIVIFGHVHEGYGHMERNGIHYMNVAMQTEKGVMFTVNRYLVHPPIVFDL